MKELHLQDLLNMADPSAHDSIGDLWNEKTVHFLVIFTSTDQDFELIGAGPTLPYKSLEEAAAHTIPGKMPEFYVKCPAAIAGRMQPRFAPMQPGVTRPGNLGPTPSLKGRTHTPFPRPELKPPPTEVEKTVTVTHEPSVATAAALPVAAPPIPAPPSDKSTDLTARERAIAQREQELTALAASLKIREAALRNREAAVTESEERLLNQSHRPG